MFELCAFDNKNSESPHCDYPGTLMLSLLLLSLLLLLLFIYLYIYLFLKHAYKYHRLCV